MRSWVCIGLILMAVTSLVITASGDPCASRSCSKCSPALGPPSCGSGSVDGCWEEGSPYLYEEFHTFGVHYVYTFWYVFKGYRMINGYAVPWYDDRGGRTGYTESYSASKVHHEYVHYAVTKWQAATQYEVTFDPPAWGCSVTVGAGGWA